jgi:phosphoribosylamine--glycine ligase
MHAAATGALIGGMPVMMESAEAPRGGTMITMNVQGACVTTVLASAGYPDAARTGDVITLPPAEDDVVVFHAGTARDAEGRLVTAGGRVLAVSALGRTVASRPDHALIALVR